MERLEPAVLLLLQSTAQSPRPGGLEKAATATGTGIVRCQSALVQTEPLGRRPADNPLDPCQSKLWHA
jgi:hypothetical protein